MQLRRDVAADSENVTGKSFGSRSGGVSGVDERMACGGGIAGRPPTGQSRD